MFYKDRGNVDTYCKQCRKNLAKEWRAKNPGRCRELRSAWREKNPGREAQGQRDRDRRDYWSDPDAYRKRASEYISSLTQEQRAKRNARRRAEYAQTPKVKARLSVLSAIRLGALVRPSQCSKCGGRGKRIEAHHEDYGKPLNVVWLCSVCHGETRRRPLPNIEVVL